MLEKIDFMQEVYKIVLDWLKRQASSVVLLSVGIVAMYSVGKEQLIKQETKIEKQEEKIEALGQEIRKCDMERAALQTEVNFMRLRLQMRFPNLDLTKN